MLKYLVMALMVVPTTLFARELPSRQMECLVRAIYLEARDQPIEGQLEVAHVVLNRTRHPDFPFTVCGVVHQRRGGTCQFSWSCTPLRTAPLRDAEAVALAQNVARVALRQNAGRPVETLYFHARRQRGRWRHLNQVAEIGDHVFYGDRR